MASRRSAILDAAVTALDAVGKPTGVTVFRTRTAALEAEDLPAIVVRRVQEESSRQAAGHKDRRSFLFAVECFVGVASQGETVEDAIDTLTSWAVQAIAAATSLQGGTGALAHSTRDVLTKWEESDTDAVYGRATVGFLSDYITAAGNPDAA